MFGMAPTIIHVQLPRATVPRAFLYDYIRNIRLMFMCRQVAMKFIKPPELFFSTELPIRSSTIMSHGFSGFPAILIFSCASYMFCSNSRFTSLKQLCSSNPLYLFLQSYTISY